jgi:hypothetical protein
MRERRERERLGARRYRLGPGSGSYSPFLPPPYESRSDEWLDHEIGIIDRALQEHGELSRQQLGERVGARYWGPGRYRAALRGAVSDGVARRVGGDRYTSARQPVGEGN